MTTNITRGACGFVHATTIDRYGNTRQYDFKMDQGVAVPTGDGRDYTVTVLKAMWKRGIPVDWSPDDLSADERRELDSFCDDCASRLRNRQVGPDEWENVCETCDEVKETIEA